MFRIENHNDFNHWIRATCKINPDDVIENEIEDLRNVYQVGGLCGVCGGGVLALSGIVNIGSMGGVISTIAGIALYFFGQLLQTQSRHIEILLDAVRVANRTEPENFLAVIKKYIVVHNVAKEAARFEAYLPAPHGSEVPKNLIKWYQTVGRNLSYEEASSHILHELNPSSSSIFQRAWSMFED